MFRCITNLKGLAIDIDSFSHIPAIEWKELTQKYKCIFITSTGESKLAAEYGIESVLELEPYKKAFGLSSQIHNQILERLGVFTTELAYVSADLNFLKYAMSFLSGSIWITPTVSYKQVSSSPDVICSSIKSLKNTLSSNGTGFLGERALFPHSASVGVIVPVSLSVNEELSTSVYMLGRYFGYSHYMNQLHPYSSSIFLNKKQRSKAYGVFSDTFFELYQAAIQRIQRNHPIDAVCSVPVRPGQENRFAKIVDQLSRACGIEDINRNFTCAANYPSQKPLSSAERAEHVKDVFEYSGTLDGKNIVLIDDIITTGATIRSCICALKAKNANEVFVVVLAVNQFPENYWSSLSPEIQCPHCKNKMTLLVNHKDKSFFYLCRNCKSTLSFDSGWSQLSARVNQNDKSK